MARPLKPIDEEQVLKLAIVGCTPSEIAATLDAAQRVIERRFGAVVKKGHEQGKRIIRSVLFQQAAKGNTAAAIFLCKAWLGMKEHPDTNINISATATGGTIQFSEESRKQLVDLAAEIRKRSFARSTPQRDLVPSGNGDQTALN